MALDLPVLLGSAREQSRTRWVARFVTERLDRRDDVDSTLYDPRELPFGNLDEREWEMDPRPGPVAAFVDAMERADGFVLCTPEYNHGYPGPLKNVLDHLYDEWNRKPFALVTTGGISGGIRAAELLRVVVGGVAAVTVPRAVAVTRIREAFTEDGPVDPEPWERRVDGLAEELVWYARALREARRASPEP